MSEQEVETMLKGVAQELIEEKPQGIKRLGIDEIKLPWSRGKKITVLFW